MLHPTPCQARNGNLTLISTPSSSLIPSPTPDTDPHFHIHAISGIITQSAAQILKWLDRNHDGILTEEEYERWRRAQI